MTAYSISGNNYVRLRDIGKAVNFGVIYDAASNTVRVNSTQPYQEETPQMGHYDAGFTLRTYTHATRQMQDQAAETMGSFMSQVM